MICGAIFGHHLETGSRPWLMLIRRLLQVAGVTVALGLVGGMFFADSLNGDAAQYRRLVEEQRVLIKTNSGVRDARNQLEIERDALRDNPAFLEKTIRQEMGYVRSNEIVLYLPN